MKDKDILWRVVSLVGVINHIWPGIKSNRLTTYCGRAEPGMAGLCLHPLTLIHFNKGMLCPGVPNILLNLSDVKDQNLLSSSYKIHHRDIPTSSPMMLLVLGSQPAQNYQDLPCSICVVM